MNSICSILFAIIISVSYSADVGFLSNVIKKYSPDSDDETTTEKWILEPATAGIEERSGRARKANERYRRQNADEESESSDIGEPDMKQEFRDVLMLKKKVQVFNSTTPGGDTVNMIAARPWGVRCGDPSLHDMPWGSCMLPQECDVELRIYKGDYFCGNSPFVCCGIVDNVYDLDKGFDASLASLEEIPKDGTDYEKEKKKKAMKAKQRRNEDRIKRKKKIKSTIKKIIVEVRKILNKLYTNGTKAKKKKTRQMKKFIQELKNQYKKDRQGMKDAHAIQMIAIDAHLMDRLNEIQKLNENFMKNETFRQIVNNGTISINGARMLLEAYPDLESYFVRLKNTRRSGRRNKNHVDYDVEYGLLYY